MTFTINSERVEMDAYETFHKKRFEKTLAEVKALAPGSVLEVGGHPWVMTARMIAEGLPVTSTVSAEEESAWPDTLNQQNRDYCIEVNGRKVSFTNYSANIERDWIEPTEKVDCVVACEIIEHLVRAPHRMLLNCNQWLNVDGHIVLTTPNGAQFSNPFRTGSRSIPFRDSVYKRHNRVFNMAELVNLFELCGFRVERADFWQVYPRTGSARMYDLLGTLPFNYLKQKFTRTLFVLARKVEDRRSAKSLPDCYIPGEFWEDIDGLRVDGH